MPGETNAQDVHRFDLFDPNRFAAGLEVHQITKIDRPLAETSEEYFSPAHRNRYRRHAAWHGSAARQSDACPTAGSEETANRQEHVGHLMRLAVHFGNTGGNASQAKAGNPRGHRREEFRDKSARQAKCLEIIATTVEAMTEMPIFDMIFSSPSSTALR